MKKYINQTLCLFVFIAVLLTAADSSSLLIFAASAPPVFVENSNKKSALEEETENFLKSVIDSGQFIPEDGSSVHEKIFGDAKASAIKIDAPSDAYHSLKRPGAKASRVPTQDRRLRRFYPEKLLSEADMVYRVAISDNLITLKEAINIGFENNIGLLAARKKKEVARAKLTEARRALFPTVQMTWEFTGGKAGATSSVPGGRIFQGDNRKINMSQPIFHGGELWFTVKQAEAGLKIANEEFKKAKGDLMRDIAGAYYSNVKSEYNTQYQEDLYKEILPLYKRVNQEKSKGLISQIDSLNIESQFRSAYLNVESARNDYRATRLALYYTLRLDPDMALPLDLKLNISKDQPDFNQVLDRALTNNSEVILKTLGLESAEWGLKIFDSKKMVKIDLRGSYGMVGEIFKDDIALESDNHDLDQEKEWFLGVTGSIPMGPNTLSYEQSKNHFGPTVLSLNGSEATKRKITFDLLDKFSDITDEKSAEAAYFQAKSDLDKARNETENLVREGFFNLQKALIATDASTSKIQYQTKQNKLNEYLIGMQDASVSTYIDGLTELASSKFGLIQSAADYNTALLGLKITSGDLEDLGQF